VIFRYLARLLMTVPGATIRTLMGFMEDPQTTRPYLSRLDPTSQHFFQTQFFSKAFDNTRQQILTRLWGVLANTVLERMFSNEKNRLDLFEAMNRGGLILINTAKDLLKQDGCEILGRFFIALLSQAAQERAAIPEDLRTSTFCILMRHRTILMKASRVFLTRRANTRSGSLLLIRTLTSLTRSCAPRSCQVRRSNWSGRISQGCGGLCQGDELRA
jgi:hypothetical protein